MSNIPNYLKVYRKRSPLQQEDMLSISGLQDVSSISRYEKGQREPTKEILLVYHYIFDTPMEHFFILESQVMLPRLIERIKERIRELEKEDQITLKNTSKIKFLEQAIIRLKNIKTI
ncbi:MAG: helix-turn-helix transcriptional regulator [Saprospiraceae bacterium]|nr:helix-turn-helix transcriptional regulator [Saprospiraceae bacterium]MBK7737531.1 helix-turn-helix transcriptional regulator [Saprospiraceae bacterium]MBK7913886.1 helix-turn-helix transcriptional regulator [Saprospiraceae bacterium]